MYNGVYISDEVQFYHVLSVYLKRLINYSENRPRNARVIVENIVTPFLSLHGVFHFALLCCECMYVYSGICRRGDDDMYAITGHEYCRYQPVSSLYCHSQPAQLGSSTSLSYSPINNTSFLYPTLT